MSTYGKPIQQHINEFLRDRHITLNKGAVSKIVAVKRAHELKKDYILSTDKKHKKVERDKIKYGEDYKTIAAASVLNQPDYMNTKSQGKVEMTVADKVEFMTRNATPLQKGNFMNADFSFNGVVKREVAQLGLSAEAGRSLDRTKQLDNTVQFEDDDYFHL